MAPRCVTAEKENPVRWKDLGHLHSRPRKIHPGCLPCRWPTEKKGSNLLSRQTAFYKGNCRLWLRWKLPLWRLVRAYAYVYAQAPTLAGGKAKGCPGCSSYQKYYWWQLPHLCTTTALANTAARSEVTTWGTAAAGYLLLALMDRLRSHRGLQAAAWPPAGLRAGAGRKREGKADTGCHPGIRLIAALWSIARGSGLFRNYQGMQRQPESSLWSLTAASEWPA